MIHRLQTCRVMAFVLCLVGISILPCQASASVFAEADVILFHIKEYATYEDVISYSEIAGDLKLSSRIVDHLFINDRNAFFDKEGRRKFRVLVLPGGEPYRWFEIMSGRGITCDGVKNILDFVSSGGSVIAICICSPSMFATRQEWLNPNLPQAKRGEWKKTNTWPGAFQNFCGVHAFKGTLRGPQESNRPYPKTRFLPIRMNPEHEIVKDAKLPSVIYQLVVGGGSILPDAGQPLEVVGWFPNNTPAIGVVPYGKGLIIMSNPHPNITGQRADFWREKVTTVHAFRWGWTTKMIEEGKEQIQKDRDPDGPEPDLALSRAMLSYAYRKAAQSGGK
jgi:glutamine amidotransferase-like uncharacterized protein